MAAEGTQFIGYTTLQNFPLFQRARGQVSGWSVQNPSGGPNLAALLAAVAATGLGMN
jgi:hypothetical protein